jgi:hypothetical protein
MLQHTSVALRIYQHNNSSVAVEVDCVLIAILFRELLFNIPELLKVSTYRDVPFSYSLAYPNPHKYPPIRQYIYTIG